MIRKGPSRPAFIHRECRPRGGGRELVLLVEDDRALQKKLQALLEAAGLEVRTCRNGSAPLAALSLQPTSLVVTNIRMPGTTGIGTTYAIQTQFPNVPILALAEPSPSSSWARYYQCKMAELMGASSVLHKPFTWRAFLYAVNDLL